MERDPRAYLWDIQQATAAIEEFVAGESPAGYARNKLVRAAVERQFTIIGEALSRLAKASPALAAHSRLRGGRSRKGLGQHASQMQGFARRGLRLA